MDLKYFDISEFDSPDLPGSGINMDASFLQLIDECRETAGIPFKITSGYRTKEYNQSLKDRGYKASKNSAHLKGLAVDIAATDSVTRHKIISAALAVGINRIGVAKTFVHLDTDPEKPAQNCIWTY